MTRQLDPLVVGPPCCECREVSRRNLQIRTKRRQCEYNAGFGRWLNLCLVCVNFRRTLHILFPQAVKLLASVVKTHVLLSTAVSIPCGLHCDGSNSSPGCLFLARAVAMDVDPWKLVSDFRMAASTYQAVHQPSSLVDLHITVSNLTFDATSGNEFVSQALDDSSDVHALEDVASFTYPSELTSRGTGPLLQSSAHSGVCFDSFDGKMGGGLNPTPLCCPKCKERRPFWCLPSESSPCKICGDQQVLDAVPSFMPNTLRCSSCKRSFPG